MTDPREKIVQDGRAMFLLERFLKTNLYDVEVRTQVTEERDEDYKDYWPTVVQQLRKDFGCFYLDKPLTQKKFAEIMGCGVATVVRWENEGRQPTNTLRRLMRFLVQNRELQEPWWNANCEHNETTHWREKMMKRHKDVHPRLEMLVEEHE